MAEADATLGQNGARQYDKSGQARAWLGPDPHTHACSTDGWFPSGSDCDTKAAKWVQELNDAAWRCAMSSRALITMDMFNARLREVVQSLANVPYMMPYRGWPCPPSETWVAGCLSPIRPREPGPFPPHKKDNGSGHPNSVDWAYHLAATLRLLPPDRRLQYMRGTDLVSDDEDTVVFMSGLPNLLSLTAFRILLESLDPPVSVQSIKHGEPLGTGCYMVRVASSDLTPFPRVSVVQLVMTFHQRLTHWPGQEPRHTLCIPCVLRPNSSFRVQHQPTILVELALAAWGIPVESWLRQPGPHTLTCGLGALDPSPIQSAEQRKAVTGMLSKALQSTWPGYMISDWAHGFDHPRKVSKLGTRQPKQKGTLCMPSSQHLQHLTPVQERDVEQAAAAAAAAKDRGFDANKDVLVVQMLVKSADLDKVQGAKAEAAAVQGAGFVMNENTSLATEVERDQELKAASAQEEAAALHEQMAAAAAQIQSAVSQLSHTITGARPDPLELEQIMSACLECELEERAQAGAAAAKAKAKDELQWWPGPGPEKHAEGCKAAEVAACWLHTVAGRAMAKDDAGGKAKDCALCLPLLRAQIVALLEDVTPEVLQLLHTILPANS